jgi:single-strand DNA-binding protein
MASVNKCIFIGNLGRDPEMRYMPSGEAIANFSIACTDSFKSKSGEKQERTEWVRIAMFGRQAEIAGEYLKKGSSVYIEGRMQTRKWQNKEGIDQYTTEIVADRMQMLGGRNSGGSYDGGMDQSNGADDNYNQTPNQNTAKQTSAPAQASTKPVSGGSGFDDFEDDIPF